MSANDLARKMLEDSKVNVKLKLSALWIALMFLYTYGDILGFYTPGIIEDLMSGKVGDIQITEVFLVVMAAWMAIPSIMVFLSLSLKAGANRWTNMVLAVISMLVLVATFFAGEFSIRYGFHALVEGVLMLLIFYHAWTWPPVTGRAASGA